MNRFNLSLCLISFMSCAESMLFDMSAGPSFINTSIGDSSSGENKLLGDFSGGSAGSIRTLNYGKYSFSLGGSYLMMDGKFRLSLEAFLPVSNDLAVYDGASLNAATVVFSVNEVSGAALTGHAASTSVLDDQLVQLNAPDSGTGKSTLVFGCNIGTAQDTCINGSLGLTPTIARSSVSVSPKFSVLMKAEYIVQDSCNDATVGVGVLRASDKFTYIAPGIAQQSAQVGFAGTDGELNTVSAETSTVFDDATYWFGLNGSVSSKFTDELSVTLSAGYYMHQFSAMSFSSGAVLIPRDVDGSCVTLDIQLKLLPLLEGSELAKSLQSVLVF